MYSKEFQEIINYRRSNRVFDANIPVPEEVMQKSLERAVLSPNSSNMQLWEFYWIKSDEELKTFIPLCLNQQAARTAKQSSTTFKLLLALKQTMLLPQLLVEQLLVSRT